jgi:hypothetical protein
MGQNLKQRNFFGYILPLDFPSAILASDQISLIYTKSQYFLLTSGSRTTVQRHPTYSPKSHPIYLLHPARVPRPPYNNPLLRHLKLRPQHTSPTPFYPPPNPVPVLSLPNSTVWFLGYKLYPLHPSHDSLPQVKGPAQLPLRYIKPCAA